MRKLVSSACSSLAAFAALLLASCASNTPPQVPVELRILAINDFHGNLKPLPNGFAGQPAGGAEAMASAVRELRAGHANNVFVAAGDLVGASPLLSALFNDEPTIAALGQMGLAISAVGNHEFDNGAAELLRKQNGGCHPSRGCQGPSSSYPGAKYQYLAASTVVEATGKPLLPPYEIRRFEGIPVGFIGLTLKGTPEIVSPEGVVGLRFEDEAETVNRYVPELRAQGVEAIVVLIHEGGYPSGGPNECPAISGPIIDIVKKLDRAVDLVVSGHTHKAYNCRIDGRLVTSADKYGSLVTAIDLKLDRATRDVISASAENVVVDPKRFPPDPAQTALIASYEQHAAPLAGRVVGRISEAFGREANTAGATTLGQLIADAQLAATQNAGAVIAMTNIGSIRNPLPYSGQGEVRYADAFATQPYYNQLLTLSLSGEQLRGVLEQQWLNQATFRPLQVSRGFSYRWDANRPVGQRVIAESMLLDGKAIEPQAVYRVTVNAYLASGGDNFPGFKTGRAPRSGVMDIEALEAYLGSAPLIRPTALDRVTRIN